MSSKHIALTILFLIGLMHAHAQTNISLQAPTSMKSGEWAEIQFTISNTSEIKNADVYLRMPDHVQVEAIEQAKGIFDHAFNGIRVEWNKLAAGSHTLRFRVKANSSDVQALRLNAILTGTQQNQTSKVESGEQTIKLL
ncbi:MAG: hypothetical protein ACK4GL_10195 [Flavobacteriales bacterium]